MSVYSLPVQHALCHTCCNQGLQPCLSDSLPDGKKVGGTGIEEANAAEVLWALPAMAKPSVRLGASIENAFGRDLDRGNLQARPWAGRLAKLCRACGCFAGCAAAAKNGCAS